MSKVYQSIRTKLVLISLAISGTIILCAVLGATLVFRQNISSLHTALEAGTRKKTEELHLVMVESIAQYQSAHLFYNLYYLDMAKTNREIKELEKKFSVTAAVITDADGRILTDGSAENPSYGSRLTEDVSALGAGEYRISKSPEGEMVLFAISSGEMVAGYGKLTFSSQHFDEIVNQQREMIDNSLTQGEKGALLLAGAGSLVLVALLLPLTLLIARRVTRPLICLKESADRVAQGDLDFRLEVTTADEIGELAKSFNQMAMDLKITRQRLLKKSEELEERVIARTEELQETGNKLQGLIDNSFDVIFTLNSEGRFLFVSPSWEEHFGSPVSEVAGQKFALFVHPDDVAPCSSYLQQVLGTMQAATSPPYRVKHRDGSWRTFIANGRPYYDPHGALLFNGVAHDITARLLAERQLLEFMTTLEQRVEERTWQLQESNKELEAFAYVVSHDLKAPLRAITSLSHWLATDYGDKLDEEGLETLNLLVQRSLRMNSLIDGILSYSRVGRGKAEVKRVDLERVVDDIIELVAPPEEVTVTIETKLPALLCDKTRIYQLFQNLISNAVKHRDKQKGEIRVGCLGAGRLCTFYVADNGPGIAEKYFERIFQMFQTLKSRDEAENTGVGLTIAKKIVELSGGRIWVESTIDAGATFWFTLPAAAMAETENAAENEETIT